MDDPNHSSIVFHLDGRPRSLLWIVRPSESYCSQKFFWLRLLEETKVLSSVEPDIPRPTPAPIPSPRGRPQPNKQLSNPPPQPEPEPVFYTSSGTGQSKNPTIVHRTEADPKVTTPKSKSEPAKNSSLYNPWNCYCTWIRENKRRGYIICLLTI